MQSNKLELYIQNKGKIYHPILENEIMLDQVRRGSCSKLHFKVVNDRKIDFQEGNPVAFKVNGKLLFYGFVFKKQRTKGQIISVTAYDQLRYWKYKDTYIFKEPKKASEVIRQIAEDRGSPLGEIEDTGFAVPPRIEEDRTFLDIAETYLDYTTMGNGKLYCLYDDAGKLTLKSIENMKVDYVATIFNMQDYDYESSIDEDVYNYIKLLYKDSEKHTVEPFEAKDQTNINKWGVLQYHEICDTKENIQQKANALLSMLNKKKRSLTLNHCFGDTRVRAGSMIYGYIEGLGDINLNHMLLVERAEHTFKESEHFMKLVVVGKDIQGNFNSGGSLSQGAKKETSGGNGSPPSSSTNAFLQKLESKKGSRYVWGASGPNSFDCSGFVSWALRETGKVPAGFRYTAQGFANDTRYTETIRKDQLRPGDLLIKHNGGNNNHIAIYIGNGKTIEAMNESKGVTNGTLRSEFTIFKRLKG